MTQNTFTSGHRLSFCMVYLVFIAIWHLIGQNKFSHLRKPIFLAEISSIQLRKVFENVSRRRHKLHAGWFGIEALASSLFIYLKII